MNRCTYVLACIIRACINKGREFICTACTKLTARRIAVMLDIITTKITDTIYEFTESADFDGSGQVRPYVDAYLLIGEEKAILVDALQKVTDLFEAVRKVTAFPIDVIITHGHLDHAGASLPKFYENGCKIYMNMKDYDLLASSVPTTKMEFFTPLEGGEIFDIGTYKLECILCPGHTEGCVVFLDRDRQLLFSGDSIGSGIIFMQIPCCISVEEYRESVRHLLEETKDLPDLKIYPGHRNQSPVQLTRQYIEDNLVIAEGILDGSMVGEKQHMDFHGKPLDYRTLEHGQMRVFCYNPENIRRK